MVVNYYSVKDIKANKYGSVFASANDESAKREYIVALRDSRSMMSQFPTDFELFYLYAIDDESGKIVDNNVKFICNGVIVKEIKDE